MLILRRCNVLCTPKVVIWSHTWRERMKAATIHKNIDDIFGWRKLLETFIFFSLTTFDCQHFDTVENIIWQLAFSVFVQSVDIPLQLDSFPSSISKSVSFCEALLKRNEEDWQAIFVAFWIASASLNPFHLVQLSPLSLSVLALSEFMHVWLPSLVMLRERHHDKLVFLLTFFLHRGLLVLSFVESQQFNCWWLMPCTSMMNSLFSTCCFQFAFHFWPIIITFVAAFEAVNWST